MLMFLLKVLRPSDQFIELHVLVERRSWRVFRGFYFLFSVETNGDLVRSNLFFFSLLATLPSASRFMFSCAFK